jgi:D-xylose transport system substrate-binding protein
VRAGKSAPAGLVNGTTTDTVSKVAVKSVLLNPEWVVPSTVESTVVHDQFVPASQICTGAYAADCTKYGIS